MDNKETYGIEKFDGTFDKEEFGVTIIPNKSMNSIRSTDALGVYCFLLGRPKGWKPNINHLKEHFQCTKEKIYKSLAFLIDNGFISRTHVKDKGRFVKTHYRVHLNRPNESTDHLVDKPAIPQADTDDSPHAGNPGSGNPDSGNPDAYKTKSVLNKEDNNIYVDSSKSTKVLKDYEKDKAFMTFYSKYPYKQKPSIAREAFHKAAKKIGMTPEDFAVMVAEDVQVRVANNWADRPKNKFPHPSTYLNTAEWEGDIYASASKDGSGYKNSVNGTGHGHSTDYAV